MHHKGRLLAVLVGLTLYSTTAHAGAISLTPTDLGICTSIGVSDSDLYIAGRTKSPAQITRDYFVFNLNGVTDPITAAKLLLSNPQDGYTSVDKSETFTLFDVETPISDLLKPKGKRPDIYDDLGEGTSFGSVVVSAADNENDVTITFNAAGIAALNAARTDRRDRRFAVGGALTTLSNRKDDEFVFGFTASNLTAQRLLLNPAPLPTPEPASLTMIVLSALVILLWHQDRLRRSVDG